MPRIGRGRLLQLSGTGAVAARTGGIAAILASGRAPAYAQGTSLHWLRWNDFIPSSDELLRNFLRLVTEKGRIGSIEEMAREFDRLRHGCVGAAQESYLDFVSRRPLCMMTDGFDEGWRGRGALQRSDDSSFG